MYWNRSAPVRWLLPGVDHAPSRWLPRTYGPRWCVSPRRALRSTERLRLPVAEATRTPTPCSSSSSTATRAETTLRQPAIRINRADRGIRTDPATRGFSTCATAAPTNVTMRTSMSPASTRATTSNLNVCGAFSIRCLRIHPQPRHRAPPAELLSNRAECRG
jgi:hypothetical protein